MSEYINIFIFINNTIPIFINNKNIQLVLFSLNIFYRLLLFTPIFEHLILLNCTYQIHDMFKYI